MDWLNRLDEALDDAAKTSQRIDDRRRKRLGDEYPASSLSEVVQHLRTTDAEERTAKDFDKLGVEAPRQSSRLAPVGSNNRSRIQTPRPSSKPSHLFDSASTNSNKDNDKATTVQPSKASPWGKALDSIKTSPDAAAKIQTSNSSELENNIETPLIKNITKTEHDGENGDAHRALGEQDKNTVLLPNLGENEDELEDVSLHDTLVLQEPATPDATANSVGTASAEEKKSSSFPQHVLLTEEFEVDRLLTTWPNNNEFDPSMNCYGVVHVRILRAQQLPCPVNSKVTAVVALPPWTGKVRTTKAGAFARRDNDAMTASVCADWSEDESAAVSMVHAYSSEESPVPSIHMSLVFSASAIGMLEIEMCNLQISCEALLNNPLTPQRGWFSTTLSSQRHQEPGRDARETGPLIQMEAVFEPEDQVVRNLLRASIAGDEHLENIDEVSIPDESCNQSISRVELEQMPSDLAPDAAIARDEHSYSDYSTSLSSFRPMDTVISSKKTHRLGLKKYYMFARCAVCSRNIASGFAQNRAFHCEICGVDCCPDCRLQVDVRLPCGSAAASAAVENSLQSKITPDNILRTIAPIPETDNSSASTSETKSVPNEKPMLATDQAGRSFQSVQKGLVGTFRATVKKAVILQTPIPQQSHAMDILRSPHVRKGDYYVRITKSSDGESSSGINTCRTEVVQHSGRPKFSATELSLPVNHYGTDYMVEVVDAASDKIVGHTILPAQAILQAQRDEFASSTIIPFVWIFSRPMDFNRTRPVVLELRSWKKQGTSSFFSKASNPGKITAVVEMDLLLEEDTQSLYGREPVKCAPKPPQTLDLAVLQSHIARLSLMIHEAKRVGELYAFLVSWENPAVTAFFALLFFQLCFFFDLEYIGGAPFFFILVVMLCLGFDRAQGRFQRRFINRGLEKLLESDESGPKTHRPVGVLGLKVSEGRNLTSPELGLPGKVSVRAFLDLCRSKPAQIEAMDKASSAPHEIGTTEGITGVNPRWRALVGSHEAKRLHQLYQNEGNLFGANEPEEASSVCFPVLQPIDPNQQLLPWLESTASVVLEVRMSDMVNLIPGADYSLGEVVVPIATLIKKGEMKGWFDVRSSDESGTLVGQDPKQVYIELQWIKPEQLLGSSPSMGSEASFAIQEEMVRSAVSYNQQKVTVLGTSVGAFNTVRGLRSNLQTVQNALGSILDVVESLMNLFNFSDPYKSSVAFAAVLVLWIVLATVPTRLLVFSGGFGQFGWTLSTRLRRGSHKEAKKMRKAPKTGPSPNPVVTWLWNALVGLPSDEDLRRTYFWDTEKVLQREATKRSTDKRTSRLRNLWKAKWYGSTEIMDKTADTANSRIGVFSVIQGHRLLCWNSVEEFDGGDVPFRQIFLSGHSGVATPSPLETKKLKREELDRIIVVFGRGETSQERVTLICETAEDRATFEQSILDAVEEKAD